jgi:hypothetical protein
MAPDGLASSEEASDRRAHESSSVALLQMMFCAGSEEKV